MYGDAPRIRQQQTATTTTARMQRDASEQRQTSDDDIRSSSSRISVIRLCDAEDEDCILLTALRESREREMWFELQVGNGEVTAHIAVVVHTGGPFITVITAASLSSVISINIQWLAVLGVQCVQHRCRPHDAYHYSTGHRRELITHGRMDGRRANRHTHILDLLVAVWHTKCIMAFHIGWGRYMRLAARQGKIKRVSFCCVSHSHIRRGRVGGRHTPILELCDNYIMMWEMDATLRSFMFFLCEHNKCAFLCGILSGSLCI